jgi:hypothetical protein
MRGESLSRKAASSSADIPKNTTAPYRNSTATPSLPTRSASGRGESASFSKPAVLIRSPTLSAWAVTRLASWSLRKTEFFILWPPSSHPKPGVAVRKFASLWAAPRFANFENR